MFDISYSINGIDVLFLYAFAFFVLLAEHTKIDLYFLFVGVIALYIGISTAHDIFRTLALAFTVYAVYRLMFPIIRSRRK